jgi:acylpyruvate hydrolase
MKIICIGRNYADHAKELNNPIPEEPVIFLKPDSAVLRNNSPFFIPDFSNEVHHEVEVLVKIIKPGKSIPVPFAPGYYEEIGLGIDFTARDLQNQLKSKGLPWEKAKAFDHSAVIGKWFPKQQFNTSNISFHLNKNGETVQRGNTKDMLLHIDEMISYVSRYFTLKIGDILFTGTPAGVGQVSAGDRLDGFIEGEQAFSFSIK